MGYIADIEQVKYRYLRALDTKHWDDFADTLTEDVVGRYGESVGEDHHFTSRDELVAFMRNSLGPEILTEHRVNHPEITVVGDEARATWYLQDRVIAPAFNFMLIGAASTTTDTAGPIAVGRSARPATTAPTTPQCR